MTPSDRDLLVFEQRRYQRYGVKVQAIRDDLGLGEWAYWQRLHQIVTDPEPGLAVEFAPLINRLRRRVEAGTRRRMRAS